MKDYRAPFQGAQEKLLCMLIALDETVAYVMNGMYGAPRELGAGIALPLASQLFSSGIIVLWFDEPMLVSFGTGVCGGCTPDVDRV